MSITAQGLKTSIQLELGSLTNEQKSDPAQAQQAWADGVTNYLNGNLQVSGIYVGTISGPAPDPLNGTYDWTFTGITISGATLLAQAGSGGFSGWVSSLELQLQSAQVLGVDDSGLITTTTPVTLAAISLGIQQADMNDATTVDEALTNFCQKFVSELLQTVMTPVSSAATSTSPGTGTVTFGSLK